MKRQIGTSRRAAEFFGGFNLNPHNPGVDGHTRNERAMHSIIYLVGLVVVVMFILSLLGLH
jgi:hypothetical protein